MEQLLDGLFRVLDPRAVLAIILLRFELLQEAEARRSGRVPGSAVLCHAETLLAAVRHLITNANSAAHFLHPRAATGGQASWRRKDSPDHQTARGFERGQRRPGMGEIPSFPGRAQDGHRAHDGQRDCVGRCLAAANITDAYPKGNAPNAVDLHGAAGCQIRTFGLACVKCLQLVRTAESLRQRRSWARISLLQIPTVRLTLSPYLTCLVPLIGFGSGVLRETGRTSNEIQTRLDGAGRRPAPGREWGWGVGGHQ